MGETTARRYEGTCDVCGATITFAHEPRGGAVDVWVDEDGLSGTWIRHIGGPESDCEVYFSRVQLVAGPRSAGEET